MREERARAGTPTKERTLPIDQISQLNKEQYKQARKAYIDSALHAAQRSIHVYIAIASVVSFLFLVSDLLQIQERDARLTIAIARYSFSILLIFMTRVLQNMRSYFGFSAVISVLEAASIGLNLYALTLYESPEFMIQSMGFVFSILVLFIIPNHKWNMLAVSILSSMAYFVCSFYCFYQLSWAQMAPVVLYTLLTILLCTYAVFSRDRVAFQEYTNAVQLEQTSSTDFLTNAVTRARLEDEAHRWMSFCRRQALPLCLVFADVDNLKYINDHFGHAAGDVVLKELAKTMRNQLRSSDTIARWGGDEFVVLLPNVSKETALMLLERVKQAVSRIDFQGGTVISCSYGVVEMGPESTYQQMLAEADAQMYQNKRSSKALGDKDSSFKEP